MTKDRSDLSNRPEADINKRRKKLGDVAGMFDRLLQAAETSSNWRYTEKVIRGW